MSRADALVESRRTDPASDPRAARRAALLLRCYPRAWRDRYGDEFTELLIADIEERPRVNDADPGRSSRRHRRQAGRRGPGRLPDPRRDDRGGRDRGRPAPSGARQPRHARRGARGLPGVRRRDAVPAHDRLGVVNHGRAVGGRPRSPLHPAGRGVRHPRHVGRDGCHPRPRDRRRDPGHRHGGHPARDRRRPPPGAARRRLRRRSRGPVHRRPPIRERLGGHRRPRRAHPRRGRRLRVGDIAVGVRLLGAPGRAGRLPAGRASVDGGHPARARGGRPRRGNRGPPGRAARPRPHVRGAPRHRRLRRDGGLPGRRGVLGGDRRRGRRRSSARA